MPDRPRGRSTAARARLRWSSDRAWDGARGGREVERGRADAAGGTGNQGRRRNPVDRQSAGERTRLSCPRPPRGDRADGCRTRPGSRGWCLRRRGRIFIAGADIKEFDQPPKPPALTEVLDCFDRSGKPIVAAIDGAALGGGLEVALACDERVVTPRARLGLPEVKLGLLPGAGGTQRLPRAIRPADALAMIADGEPRSGEAAMAIGLADRLAEPGELLSVAAGRARALAGRAGASASAMGRLDPGERPAFETAAAALLGSRGGEPQIEAIVDCVRNSFELGFDEGMRRERAAFPPAARGRALESHAVCVPCRAPERIPVQGSAARRGPAGCGDRRRHDGRGHRDELRQRRHSGHGRGDRRGGCGPRRIADRRDLRAFGAPRQPRCEAHREGAHRQDRDVGRASRPLPMPIWSSRRCSRTWISRSRCLPSSKPRHGPMRCSPRTPPISTSTRLPHPPAVPSVSLGMHFFSPANVMKLVEVVRGKATSETALATVVEAARRIGKIPVVVGVCHGFVGNRMLCAPQRAGGPAAPRRRAAGRGRPGAHRFRLQNGSLRHERSCRPRHRLAHAARHRQVGAGGRRAREGRAAGAEDRQGLLSTIPTDGRPVADPAVEMLLRDVSDRSRHRAARGSDRQEILDRLLLPMINEGARILEEGIAARARRHRRDLAARLQLPALAGRSDVPCRPDGPRRGRPAALSPMPRRPATRRCALRRCWSGWPRKSGALPRSPSQADTPDADTLRTAARRRRLSGCGACCEPAAIWRASGPPRTGSALWPSLRGRFRCRDS